MLTITHAARLHSEYLWAPPCLRLFLVSARLSYVFRSHVGTCLHITFSTVYFNVQESQALCVFIIEEFCFLFHFDVALLLFHIQLLYACVSPLRSLRATEYVSLLVHSLGFCTVVEAVLVRELHFQTLWPAVLTFCANVTLIGCSVNDYSNKLWCRDPVAQKPREVSAEHHRVIFVRNFSRYTRNCSRLASRLCLLIASACLCPWIVNHSRSSPVCRPTAGLFQCVSEI